MNAAFAGLAIGASSVRVFTVGACPSNVLFLPPSHNFLFIPFINGGVVVAGGGVVGVGGLLEGG